MTPSGWWTGSVAPASNTQSDVQAEIIAEFILPLSNRHCDEPNHTPWLVAHSSPVLA